MEQYGIGTDATVADHIQKQVGAPALGSTGGGGAFAWPPRAVRCHRRHADGGGAGHRATSPFSSIPGQLDRGYAVKDESGRTQTFSATPLGESLISAYSRMGLTNLWQPQLRGHIESNITAVAQGRSTKVCWGGRGHAWLGLEMEDKGGGLFVP